MTAPLRILHLEDDPLDADLILTTLAEGGIACRSQRVDNQQAFLAALKAEQVDVIFADYSLPGFDGLAALEVAQAVAPDIPFLFVSATLGEELAIDAMHRGATDYVLKQRLGRLIPSVHRALRELQDRTERKRAEDALHESEKQLRQAQKMEAVGRLAGGLAHDFNNMLTVIMGHSQILLSEMGLHHPLRNKIEEIQKAGDRATGLIRQLLTFSRKQPSEPKILNLNTVVADFELMLRRLIGEDVELVLLQSSENLCVKADHAQLEQILMNLVINARDAMPKGGRLTIETASVILDSTPMYHLTPLAPGTYVRLSVCDTGCGMSSEIQAHMFEPFFTTKEEGKGTGLGLSTVFGIVAQSGGGMDVLSTVGQGTRFNVYLPMMAVELGVTISHDAPTQPVRGHETILLVEDDEGVRLLIRDELRKLGYRVFEAKNGLEACLMATQHMASLQLLVTDIVMPGMSGIELARHLRAIKPELKCLFMSGYTDDVNVGAGDPASTYLQKPFLPGRLAKTIRDLLEYRPGRTVRGIQPSEASALLSQATRS